MLSSLDRYTLDELPSPAAPVRVMRQRLDDVSVHWHDFHELVLVLAGDATHVCNGVERPVAPGTALLLSPADVHGFRRGTRTVEALNLVVDPWVVEPWLDGLLDPTTPRGDWHVDDVTHLRHDLERAWREQERAAPGSAQVVEALTRCALVELAREVGAQQPRPVTGDDPMRRALRHVDQHFREPLTLVEVAAQARLSPNWFSERFHAWTGTSFQAYLLARRLRFARSLLLGTDVTVTEACHACGFNDTSYFGRAYRARYGVSPTQDRRRPRHP